VSALDEIIFKRRSIRKYKPEPPPEEWIAAMLSSAARAPSPTNSRPVRFIRIKSPDVRQTLFQAMNEGYRAYLEAAKTCKRPRHTTNVIHVYWRYSKFIRQAPLLFAVGTVTERAGLSKKLFEADMIEEIKKTDTDVDIAVGLALKGFILKGTELGLGTCILTAPLSFIGDMESILGIDNIRIKCLVTVGFPDETPPSIAEPNPAGMYMEV
jgi:nitroreductase